jgi:general secretion pathway protein D
MQESEQRVPLLSSIPILGRAFRSTSIKATKSNLLVFIRATVVRDEATLTGATAQKYRYIRDQQLLKRERGALLGDDGLLPVLPEMEGFDLPLAPEPAPAVPRQPIDLRDAVAREQVQ